jgi:hypothetical protein
MPHRLYDLVAERAKHRCEYCRAVEAISNSPFEVEHIQPTAQGGADDAVNLALSCSACNRSKQAATTGLDPQTVLVVRLFNPRTDLWHEHFVFNLATAYLMGRTDVGRATVARLRMNGPTRLRARRFWIALFGFPDDPPTFQE